MRWVVVGLIRVYRLAVSPVLGSCCRFYPSCSEYGMEAVKKWGVIRGGWLMVKRLVKCGPWHRGGVDEVP